MSFDNTKYHCEINSVPYMIRGYQKTELSTFIPRLGSGDQTESEFDLLKSKTIDGFSGGSLQRFWEDNTSVFASEGLYPVYDDGVLYPVNAPVNATQLLGSTKAKMTAYCVSTNYAFVAYITFNTPTNYIRRIDSSGTEVVLTLPSSLSTSTAITSMVIWNDQLWIQTGTTSVWYMPLSSTTVTDITGGTSGHMTQLAVLNGQLYGTSGTNQNRKIIRYTGSTSSKSFVEVGDTGKHDSDATAQLFLYNNRLMLTRKDGMYAYDGVRMVTIESSDSHPYNYTFATVLKGYMYYFMPDGFYRFNGSLIEKLYDIAEIGYPVDVFASKDRIWMFYRNSQFSGVSRYDKAMGYDYGNDDEPADGRVMVFNGKGLYTYARTETITKNPAGADVSDQGEIYKGFHFNNKLYITTYYENTVGNRYYTIDTNEKAATGNKTWRVVSSIFDAEFPMVDKNLENLELTFDGNVSSDQDITLEYRTGGFDGSTGWTSLGTIKSTSRLKDHVFRTLPNGVVFKRIQFRLTGTTAATYGLSKFIVRYTLTPDVKWQWSITALCYGDNAVSPLQLADDTDGSQAVSLLRGNLYDARTSDVPIKFLDIDQFDLNGAINNSVTTVTLNSTAMLKDYGFIQIDDEIIYYAAKTSTTLTGCLRAMMGTTAASHSDNAKVFPVYRTLIRQLKNENIELMEQSIDIAESKSRSSEITLLIQEV